MKDESNRRKFDSCGRYLFCLADGNESQSRPAWQIRVSLLHATNFKNEKEKQTMANSTSSNNRLEVPEAKSAMERFKMEVANEIGVPLTDGYNGNLTSAQNGSVGGYMVKKMIENQERMMSNKQ